MLDENMFLGGREKNKKIQITTKVSVKAYVYYMCWIADANKIGWLT